MAQEQIASTVQPLVDGIQYLTARSIVEIDQDVSAEGHVDAPNDCGAPLIHQVQMTEVAHRPDARVYLPAFIGFDEVLRVLGNHGPEARGAVGRPTRFAQDSTRDVVSEHTDVPAIEETAGIDEHRDRKDLFAARASRAPNVEPLRAARKRPRAHDWKDLIGEGSKLVRFAEEIGLVGRQNLGRCFELSFGLWVVLQVTVVLRETPDSQLAKTLAKTPFDDVRRVVGEVDPTEPIDEIPDQTEFPQLQTRSCVVQQGHVTHLAEGRSRLRA